MNAHVGEEFTVGSLFSGIGGLDCGLTRAGWRYVFFCESDPWRRSVLAHHWPGVPIYDDVRAVGKPEGRTPADRGGAPADLGGWEAGTGLLCGGFPCQDLSVAGRRAGLHAGERSSLFFEFARIVDAVRPRWVLVENVPGLLSSQGGRDFGVVLGTLADLGYGLAWRVLDSRFFGVPQRRRRVFILGAVADGDPRADAERAGQVLTVGTRCPRHPATRGEAREDAAVPFDGGAISTLQKPNGGWRIDAEAAAGGHLVTAFSHTQGIDAQPSASAWLTLRRDGGGHAVGVAAQVRRLTPVECERLQGLPDGWTNPDGKAPDSRRYAALGDAVTATVGEWLGHRIASAA